MIHPQTKTPRPVAEPLGAPRPGRAYRLGKRTIDVALSAGALIALAPLMGAIGAAVAASSPGGAIFRQERVGRGGRTFTLLKFRSMRAGAGGPGITAGGDARVTPLGRFLRRTKLDELPQLWNVLAGDMSLVGPRPEVPRYVERFAAEYAAVLTVRPGLTDYAALAFRDEEAVLAGAPDPEATYVEVVLPAKLALYRRYLREMSFTTDLTLIARTLRVLLP